ncbi:DEAD/DEAH box helicase [Bacillus smithii]|uniref:DEAD/DEAH box helicase n=1 Tax=Bacillus smithii TaxID=1479 RepID=UPI003D22D7DF
MSDTFESAYNHPVLNKVLDSLTRNAFLRDIGLEKEIEKIDYEDLHHASWLATILSNANDDKHLNKALSFAVLAYLDNKDSPRFEQLCYIIQSRTGNIPASMHLQNLFDDNDKFKRSFGSMLDVEMGINRANSKMKIANKDIYGTKFQLELMKLIESKKHIAISAPTSSGKSFIIQGFIVNSILKEKEFKAIYIVPTRALIYQVTRQLREQLKDVDISIKNTIDDVEFNTPLSKEILVLTPERSLKLLDTSMQVEYNPNLIFIDEIQNIEDETRGVLLEYVLRELHLKWRNSQIIVAGPFITDLPEILREICNIESTPTQTFTSPVFQLKIALQAKKGDKRLKTTIISPSGTLINHKISLPKSIYSKLKSNTGEAIALLVSQIGKHSNNIIYSPRTDSAEKWANKLSLNLNKSNYIEIPEIIELIDYLSREIHPKYSLIECLKKGVGFHHGSVPDIARTEIEELYSNGILTNIVCTSTLLEGVNLPAQKLFIAKAKIGDEPMEDFDFGNLIGRTGRMNFSLYGSIYCLEIEEDAWTEEKLNNDFEKEIIPATTNALTKDIQELLSSILSNPLEIKSKSIAYTIGLLRHKFLKNELELRNFLLSKSIGDSSISVIIDRIKKSVKQLTIPYNIIKLNPTIDPILQDTLYKKISKDGIQKWLINKKPFRQAQVAIETQRMMPFEDREFYGQFELVAERLNEIFDIESESSTNGVFQSIRQMVRDAFMWLRGNSYRAIIESELKNNKIKGDDFDEINKCIRKVTKIINRNVMFLLVKYFKLWSDILINLMNDKEKEDNKYILSLPNMLELGSDNPTILKLISEGLSRSVAIEIGKQIPANLDVPIKEWLQKNPPKNLSPLYYKQLINRGYLN